MSLLDRYSYVDEDFRKPSLGTKVWRAVKHRVLAPLARRAGDYIRRRLGGRGQLRGGAWGVQPKSAEERERARNSRASRQHRRRVLNRAPPPAPKRKRARRLGPDDAVPPAPDDDDGGAPEMPDDDRPDEPDPDRTESEAEPDEKIPREGRNKRWGPYWADRAVRQDGATAEEADLIREDPRSDAGMRGLMSAEQLAAHKESIARRDPQGPANVPYLGNKPHDPAVANRGLEAKRRGEIADEVMPGKHGERVKTYERDGKVVRGYMRAPDGAPITRLEREKELGYMRPRYGHAGYESNGPGRHATPVGPAIDGPRYSWSRHGRSKRTGEPRHPGEPAEIWKPKSDRPGYRQRPFFSALRMRERALGSAVH